MRTILLIAGVIMIIVGLPISVIYGLQARIDINCLHGSSQCFNPLGIGNNHFQSDLALSEGLLVFGVLLIVVGCGLAFFSFVKRSNQAPVLERPIESSSQASVTKPAQYCKYCGNKVPLDSLFCNKCGQKFN